MNFIRIKLVPTDRTDLICIYCYKYRTDQALEPTNGSEPMVGVHKGCIDAMHHKRGGQ